MAVSRSTNKIINEYEDEFSISKSEVTDLKTKISELEKQANEKNKLLESLKQQKNENQKEIMFLRDQNQRVIKEKESLAMGQVIIG